MPFEPNNQILRSGRLIKMKKRSRLYALFALAIAFAIVLAGCGGGGSDEAGNAGEATVADAETIYKRHCLSCHKADLSGMNLNNVGSRRTLEEIEEKIRKGGGGMIAFENRLSDEEIAALSTWLAEMK
jgi:cytochrome c551